LGHEWAADGACLELLPDISTDNSSPTFARRVSQDLGHFLDRYHAALDEDSRRRWGARRSIPSRPPCCGLG